MSARVAIFTCDAPWRPNGPIVEHQEAVCRGLAAKAGCEVVAVFDGDDTGAEDRATGQWHPWQDLGAAIEASGAEVLVFETLDLFVDQNYFAVDLIVTNSIGEVAWFSVAEGLVPIGNAYHLLIAALAAHADRPATLAGPPFADSPVSGTSQRIADKSAAVALLRGAFGEEYGATGNGIEGPSS